MCRHLFILVSFAVLLASATACADGGDKCQGHVDEQTAKHLEEWHGDKLGMFVHFGLYSIPAGVWKGEKIPYYSEQIMNHARIPAAEYEKLAQEFNPVGWSADEVVKLAKEAGMKYIVFTAKHHDGFCMFKTATTDYNVVDATPYGKDIVGELADACKRHGVKFGLYYSLPDWHFDSGIPRLDPDSTTNCTEYVNQVYSPIEAITPELEECIVAQLTELLTNYGEIETIWFDMGLPTESQSQRFRKVVKSLQPSCLISGRIMNNQGDYLTLPDNGVVAGYSETQWDNPASLYGTWGYRSWQERPDEEVQVRCQICRLMSTVSHGGVFLLNIGPTGNGEIIDYEKRVFSRIGEWVSQNSEAIYGTKASPFEKLTGAFATLGANRLYFTVVDSISELDCYGLKSIPLRAYVLENSMPLSFSDGNNIVVKLPEDRMGDVYVVVLEFDGAPVVEPEYIEPDGDGNYVLLEEDCIVHAAFDSRSYLSSQMNSWISWYVDVVEGAEYDVFAVYTPDYYDKRYLFACGSDSIVCVLPGVDDMMQTCYVGKLNIAKGKTDFCVRSDVMSGKLDDLGLVMNKIVLKRR